MLPFSHEQFVAVFASYNLAVWPAPLAGYLLGLLICAGAVRGGRAAPWAGAGLAMLWAWTGAIYHGLFFSRINALAPVFAAAFVAQAVLLVHASLSGRLAFGPARAHGRELAGWALVAYAAVLYPLLGWAAGLAYPAAPVFGITPCPLALFTWGLLLIARAAPWWLVPIPLAWSLVGGSAAFLLGVPQDWLLAASVLCAPWVLWRRHAA